MVNQSECLYDDHTYCGKGTAYDDLCTDYILHDQLEAGSYFFYYDSGSGRRPCMDHLEITSDL